ncbi:MAG: polyprenyl synthetase family protein [Thermus sp.]|uniref:polyprenyl synthetase family protein n=1 Tax=unclassified Thermus TaxID=2619321 RepID=UPI0002389F44|nr:MULTISPECIES: polyprenyl synthetase family protein [unclassified Thermus]AEV15548.1 Dimethylallyltranstransferase [Thermus sp. CCB_US3_UF1]MCS7218452.1 polyprenyl synthetase family protein [Thermus sp.]MCX7849224.1 polyprenyl synthetase family protein [Thermus sp.]MDW8016793.1 polyprenyl synthetase family protein [Thermus sp.]
MTVQEALEAPLLRFEQALSELVQSEVLFIRLIHQDLVTAGGKRIRPRLVFLASRALGGAPFELELALAVELLHSATLLHDDLIDEAETRRGKEAAFRKYGNAVSVLSGDFLLSRLLHVIAKTGRMELVERFAQVAKTLSEGEVLQFQVAALEDYSLENYERIITAKTAVLMALATEGPALLREEPLEVRQALYRFGLLYGQAFQMRDDYLDLMGTPEVLGKPVGGDVREGKATLITLLLMERFPEVREVLRRKGREPGDLERLRDLARKSGVAREVEAHIRQRAQQAAEALAFLPDSPYKEALKALALKEAERLA